MRQGTNVKRSRGRGGRKANNPRSHVFDSNGPSVRIRGNAMQVYEKYQQLARDTFATDRIAAENLAQHAEHYYRVAVANNAQANGADRRGGPQQGRLNGHEGADFDGRQRHQTPAASADDGAATSDGAAAEEAAPAAQPGEADEPSESKPETTPS